MFIVRHSQMVRAKGEIAAVQQVTAEWDQVLQ